MDITYERTWCDYLTPCPHGNDCMVGDEDCVNNCGYCVGSVIEEPEKNMPQVITIGTQTSQKVKLPACMDYDRGNPFEK